MAPTPHKAMAFNRVRCHPRARTEGHVMVHDETHLFIAPLVDISAGGVFIKHLVTLPMGHEVKVVIKCPRLDFPVQAQGTIVRIEKDQRKGCAVRFTEISDTAKEAIQAGVFEMRMEAALKAAA